MAFVFITNYFFNGPLFMPTWFGPSMSPRFRRYLYPFNVTQIDRVIKIFILLRTNGRTNISMIYNLTLSKVNKNRLVNSGIEVVIMLKAASIPLATAEMKAMATQYNSPWPCSSLEQHIRMKKPNLQLVGPEWGDYYHCLYYCLYSTKC